MSTIVQRSTHKKRKNNTISNYAIHTDVKQIMSMDINNDKSDNSLEWLRHNKKLCNLEKLRDSMKPKSSTLVKLGAILDSYNSQFLNMQKQSELEITLN